MEKLKRYRKLLLTAIMLLFVLFAEGMVHLFASRLDSQQLASRWAKEDSYAQVSVFSTPEAKVEEGQMLPFSVQLKSTIEEAGVEADSENGRSYVLAYSGLGSLMLSGSKNSVTANAYGVSEDFFLFHPLELVSGSLAFSGEEQEADTIVLDENAAWQLFGAIDVAGMGVEIGQRTYIIGGVVKSENGLFAEQSGAQKVTVYVPFWVLKEQDEEATVDCIEVLVKNPVKKFGYDTVKNLVESTLNLNEGSYAIVENSTRYDIPNRFQTLKNFGVRSMKLDGMIYPYWENRAAAMDDVAALLLAIELLLLIYPACMAACLIHYCWKHKKAAGRWLWEHLIWLVRQAGSGLRSVHGISKSKKSMKSTKSR